MTDLGLKNGCILFAVFVCFHGAYETVNCFFCYVLHYNDMRKIATEIFVMAVCEIVFPDYCVRRTCKENSIAISVVPTFYADGC